MSKTAQRKVSAKARNRQRFLMGMQEAERQRRTGGGGFWWWPSCMAWRAGFYKGGGKKFW